MPTSTPNPAPTTLQRAAKRAGSVMPAATTGADKARGISSEATENHAIPNAMTRLPPYLSAMVPPKSWVAM